MENEAIERGHELAKRDAGEEWKDYYGPLGINLREGPDGNPMGYEETNTE